MSKYTFNVNNFSIEKDERFFAYINTIDANRIVKMLNKQEAEIKNLKETIIEITMAYQRKYDDTIVNLINKGLTNEEIIDLLNKQDERMETLKEDVEIILDYVLNKGKFAMSVKEQKAHNRLRDFVRGDME